MVKEVRDRVAEAPRPTPQKPPAQAETRAAAPQGPQPAAPGPEPAREAQEAPAERAVEPVGRTLEARDTADFSDEVRAFHGEPAPAHSEPEPAHDGDHPPEPEDPQNPGTPEGTNNQRPSDTDTLPTQEEIDAATEAYRESGDPADLNEIDQFREQLPPDQQAEYDRQLAELREDERVRFNYTEGAERDPALEDLVLRGLLASTYGRPDRLEELLQGGAEGDNGALDIDVSGSNDLNGDEEGVVTGYASRDYDIELSADGFLRSLTSGAGTAVHEFTHAQQLGGDGPESNFDDYGILPPDVSDRQAEKFQQLYTDAYGENDDTVHLFTQVQDDFRSDPEALRQRSPELYDWMVNYYNYDPIAGEARPDPSLGDIFGGIWDTIREGAGNWWDRIREAA